MFESNRIFLGILFPFLQLLCCFHECPGNSALQNFDNASIPTHVGERRMVPERAQSLSDVIWWVVDAPPFDIFDT